MSYETFDVPGYLGKVTLYAIGREWVVAVNGKTRAVYQNRATAEAHARGLVSSIAADARIMNERARGVK